jgi:hypothetical protein
MKKQVHGQTKEHVKSGHGPQRAARHQDILADWPSATNLTPLQVRRFYYTPILRSYIHEGLGQLQLQSTVSQHQRLLAERLRKRESTRFSLWLHGASPKGTPHRTGPSEEQEPASCTGSAPSQLRPSQHLVPAAHPASYDRASFLYQQRTQPATTEPASCTGSAPSQLRPSQHLVPAAHPASYDRASILYQQRTQPATTENDWLLDLHSERTSGPFRANINFQVANTSVRVTNTTVRVSIQCDYPTSTAHWIGNL